MNDHAVSARKIVKDILYIHAHESLEAATAYLEPLLVEMNEWRERACRAEIRQVEDAAKEAPWRFAALLVGESLTATGPDGYYDFTAQQWQNWALSSIERYVNDAASGSGEAKE